jgi:hypothetical protein
MFQNLSQPIEKPNLFFSKSRYMIHGIALIGCERTSDEGANAAHPVASGYQRVILSPGVEFDMDPLSVYAGIAVVIASRKVVDISMQFYNAGQAGFLNMLQARGMPYASENAFLQRDDSAA